MHIYFVGIGGTGVGPLALIAQQAGYTVSGSDAKHSEYTDYLTKKGVRLHIGQTEEGIEKVHHTEPIDWIVAVSAITRNQADHPEITFGRNANIKVSERDEFLNRILEEKNLQMIAIAGTHGKTTTTAMAVWALRKCGVPISYSVGAKMSFADMGHYDEKSTFFVYECDEFHRNFLHFSPRLSLISGITWDHHEVFPTREDYKDAFKQFISQSEATIMHHEDATYIDIQSSDRVSILNSEDQKDSDSIVLPGKYNRLNAEIVARGIHALFGFPLDEIRKILSQFPGTSRRMEELKKNIFTDYAHTPEKIRGCMSVAKEIATQRGLKKIVVVYEPLTNRRQHFMKNDYKDCFFGADHVYWVPTYLARENPEQKILTPEELITYIDQTQSASAAKLDEDLWKTIKHLQNEALIVCMSGGGGDSLDEWLRARVQSL